MFLAEIWRDGILYNPIETEFKAHSKEIFLQKLRAEFLTAHLISFVGILRYKKILRALSTEFEIIFKFKI